MEYILDKDDAPAVKNTSTPLVAAKWLIMLYYIFCVVLFIFKESIVNVLAPENYVLLVSLLAWLIPASWICVACSSRRLRTVGIILISVNICNVILTPFINISYGTGTNAIIGLFIPKFIYLFGLSLLWLKAGTVRQAVAANILITIIDWGLKLTIILGYPFAVTQEIFFSNADFLNLKQGIDSILHLTEYLSIVLGVASAAFWWKALTWLRPADVDDTPMLSTFTSRPFVSAIVIMALIFGAFLLLRNIIIVPNYPQLF